MPSAATKKRNVLCVIISDKLTAALPVLRPGEQGVPLPKVAAHVTGVAVSSFTEPPTADGEDVLMECRKTNMKPAV